MRKVVVLMVVVTLCAGPVLCAEGDVPWWKEQKIRFMWGQWSHARVDKDANFWGADLPRELFRNVARAGGTVFVELRGYKPEHARHAHEFGLKYFATRFAATDLPGIDGRRSVKQDGEEHMSPCPLFEPAYEKLLVEPIMEGVKAGLVDGLHTDWEHYGGRGEAGICYCDDCFLTFLKIKGLKADPPPEKLKRFEWLTGRDLVAAYRDNFTKRRIEMFTRIREKLQAAHPTFMFSGYYMRGAGPGVRRGLHTSEAPFIIVDSRHYSEDEARPWWDSKQEHYRAEGYLRIAGTWNQRFFGGAPATHVSLAQWLYDAALHADGAWVWFEQEVTPDTWRAFWMGHRRISAVEAKVGSYLMRGQRDRHFVTPVEWTGNPQLADAIRHVTYHLEGAHLIHVNNVDTDRPVQVRLRLGRSKGTSNWSVRDPINDLYYAADNATSVWRAAQLKDGIAVSLEPRSDLFLLVAPAASQPLAEPASIIQHADMRSMPDHPRTKPAHAPHEAGPAGPDSLLYLATQPLGYDGAQGGWAIGNAIFLTDAEGIQHERLYGLKAYLWAPTWSPDGRRIAFSCYANGRGQIFVMNADGTGARNISRNRHCDRSPSWSPDGRRIAFVSNRSGDWEIYAMGADGGAPRRLTASRGVDRRPVWSPDGARIAFESNRATDLDVYVMNADGADLRNVTGGMPGLEMHPTWSPDGARIACSATGFATRRRLLVVDADGARLRTVFRYATDILSLAWSPDGQHIAVAFRYGGPAGVLLVGPDDDVGHLSNLVPAPFGNASSDTHVAAFADAIRPHPGGGGPHPTWYSMGTASRRWLSRTFGGLSWSADGKRLAFSSDMEDGSFYVYVWSPGGGKPKRLDHTKSAWLNQVAWRPRQTQ